MLGWLLNLGFAGGAGVFASEVCYLDLEGTISNTALALSGSISDELALAGTILGSLPLEGDIADSLPLSGRVC